ncbi:MAG: hypothetical protein ACRYFZ_20520 [Janthinobacterium lividum]
MIRCYVLIGLSIILLLGLGGCSVYTPMLGAAPEIRGKGELEVTGSWSLTDRLDVGATYSPLPHVLVRAAASLKGSSHSSADSSSYVRNNQYEVGLGTYWPLGPHWLVGGLVAYGQAHAQARYADDGTTFISFREPVQHQFDAVYSKYSGEAYVTWQPISFLSAGLAYRVVQVRLTDATNFGVPVQSAPILRSEPMLFVRLRPSFFQRSFQMQVALGGSSTFGYSARSADDRDDPARQFKLGRSYVSVGVAFYPHQLWHNK